MTAQDMLYHCFQRHHLRHSNAMPLASALETGISATNKDLSHDTAIAKQEDAFLQGAAMNPCPSEWRHRAKRGSCYRGGGSKERVAVHFGLFAGLKPACASCTVMQQSRDDCTRVVSNQSSPCSDSATPPFILQSETAYLIHHPLGNQRR